MNNFKRHPFEDTEGRLNIFKMGTGNYISLNNNEACKELCDLCHSLMNLVYL
jgi:hypothetical protein